jgi:hypothetical protein
MSASGTLFLQTFVFFIESRIFRFCQEIRDILPHGRRRKSLTPGPSKTLSATVAGAWPSTKKLATGESIDCTQVRSCTAGESYPPRRAVRNTQTHANTCQTQHRTPAIREIAVVAAAHAEAKTVVTTTTQRNVASKAEAVKVPAVMASASKATAAAARTPAARPSAAACRIPS